MAIEIVERKGNLLKLEVKITHDRGKITMQQTSSNYLIGTVYFQLTVDSSNSSIDSKGFFVITARYTNAAENDNLLYNCSVKINQEVQEWDVTECGIVCSMTRKTETAVNFTAKNLWHLILKKEESLSFKFQAIVQFDLGTSVTPLIASLYEDTELTDFNLKGEDGSSVSVHSNILARVSPVLKKMLNGNWQETLNRSVTIADATKEILEQFKEYMYLDKLPETGLDKLFLLGKCYLIPDLMQKCIVKIMFTMTPDNIVDFIKFAVTNNMDDLLAAILKLGYQSVNLDYLPKENWKKMLQVTELAVED